MSPSPPGQVIVEILALSTGIPRTELVEAGSAAQRDGRSVLQQLFGERVGPALPPKPLREACVPVAGRIYAGTFGSTTLVCGAELLELVDLGPIVAALSQGRLTFRLQIDSTIPSTALMIADADGDPVREVMLVAGEEPVFDEGPHLAFEAPFWRNRRGQASSDVSSSNGGAPARPDPVEFGLAALRELFGVGLTEPAGFGDLPADAVVLDGYALAPDIASTGRFAGVDAAMPGGMSSRDDSGSGPFVRGGWSDNDSGGSPGQPRSQTAESAAAQAGQPAPKRRSWLGRLWNQLFPSD